VIAVTPTWRSSWVTVMLDSPFMVVVYSFDGSVLKECLFPMLRRRLGISRQCVHRWVARFDAEGDVGMEDRSSRPHSSPTRTSSEIEQQVVAARAELRVGPDRLSDELGVPARTISRILRRHQVPYLWECDPLTGDVIRASRVTTTCYERDRPGELIHIDVKKIGKISDGGGWKAWGRNMGSTSAKRKAHIGYDYVHLAVDDHSRLAY